MTKPLLLQRIQWGSYPRRLARAAVGSVDSDGVCRPVYGVADRAAAGRGEIEWCALTSRRLLTGCGTPARCRGCG
jgi:hypothetical protein